MRMDYADRNAIIRRYISIGESHAVHRIDMGYVVMTLAKEIRPSRQARQSTTHQSRAESFEQRDPGAS